MVVRLTMASDYHMFVFAVKACSNGSLAQYIGALLIFRFLSLCVEFLDISTVCAVNHPPW